MPAKYMPVAIRDETGAFIRQMAQGNEALARLYVQLLARYQERLAAQEFRREEREAARQATRENIYLREDLFRGRKDASTTTVDNPLSRGAAAHPRTQQPTTAAPAPAAAPTRVVPPHLKPMPNLGNQPPGSQQFTPQGSDSKKFSSNAAGMDAFAMAPSGADHTDFSAQSIVQGGAEPRPEKGQPSTIRAGTSVRDPQQLPRTRTTKTKMAEFLPIRREWLDMMAAEEKKHKLPQGTLLTLYGMENAGGKVFGNNPEKAYGMFQWTKKLRQQYGISDQDAMNPAVMIPATAANLAANAKEFKRVSGKNLPNTAEFMPYWTGLHQWGIGDGPRILTAALSDSGHMLARKVMLEKPGGVARDNAAVLKLNQLNPNATVADLIRDQSTRGSPYHTASLKVMTNPDEYGTTDDDEQKPGSPLRGAQGQPYGGYPRGANFMRGRPDPNAIVPINVRGVGDVRVHRDAAPAFQGFLNDLITAGAPIRTVYGQVDKNIRGTRQISQHAYGNGIDIEQQGRNLVSPAFRQWASQNMDVIRNAQIKNNIYSGGDWRSPDFGHFEWNGKPVAVATAQVATTAKPAAAAQPAAQPAAAPIPYTPTPMEAQTPDKAAVTAAMFGVGPQEPLADMMRGNIRTSADRGFGEQYPRPIPRQSQMMPFTPQGPQQQLPELDISTPMPSITPQASGVAARSDLDYNMPREAPDVGPYEAPPAELPDREAPAVGPYEAPPPALMPPTDDIATGDAVPQQATPQDWPGLPPDWEELPRGPDIRGPAISLNMPPIGATNREPVVDPNAWELPDVASLPPNPPELTTGDMAASDPNSWSGRRAAANRQKLIAAAGQQYPMEDAKPFTPQQPSVLERIVSNANIVPTDAPQQPQVAQVSRPPIADIEADARARDVTPSLKAVRDAIFSGERRQAPPLSPTTQRAVDAIKRNIPPTPNPAIQQLRVGTPPSLPSGLQRAPQVQQQVQAADNQRSFMDAAREWIAKQNAERLRYQQIMTADRPNRVKTINPLAPDRTSVKPNAATTKQHPNARVEQDEPLVLTKKPSSTQVPFQGITQQSTHTQQAPPMARKGQTTATTPQQQAPAGFEYRKVGPGQFIKVPIGAPVETTEEQQQELTVE